MWNARYFEINEHTVTLERLPKAFDGMTIMQLSDLHDKEYGYNNELLIATIKDNNPDLIFVTGDLYDLEEDIALHLLEAAIKVAPVYYCTGNHEARTGEHYDALEPDMIKLGVHVLRNETELLTKDDESIAIMGIDDPEHLPPNMSDAMIINDEIRIARKEVSSACTILLSHRPEVFDVYVKNDIDLVFTGHAHGGQIRLPFWPFKEGIASVNQGMAPKYTAGIHEENNTKMVISRGLTNHVWLPRIMNPPEIVIIHLRANK